MCEWKAVQLDAKGLQMQEFPRADTHSRLLEVNTTGSSRTQEHCLISKMNADIIIMCRRSFYFTSHVIMLWTPLKMQFIRFHSGFIVVEVQQLVYYLFVSWRIRNLSSSHVDLPGAPLWHRHRARTASRLVVNWEITVEMMRGATVCGQHQFIISCVVEREGAAHRREEHLGHTVLCKISSVPYRYLKKK